MWDQSRKHIRYLADDPPKQIGTDTHREPGRDPSPKVANGVST